MLGSRLPLAGEPIQMHGGAIFGCQSLIQSGHSAPRTGSHFWTGQPQGCFTDITRFAAMILRDTIGRNAKIASQFSAECPSPSCHRRESRLGGSGIGRRMPETSLGYLVWRGDPPIVLFQTFSDLLNRRGNNRSSIFRVREFEVHTTSNEAQLQHRATPSRTCNGDTNWSRAVFGMPTDQRLAATQDYCGVAMVFGLDLQNRGR